MTFDLAQGKTMQKRKWTRHPEGALVQRTRVLFWASMDTVFETSRATGIPVSWLNRFGNRQIADPGVNRVEALYTHLTGHTPELK